MKRFRCRKKLLPKHFCYWTDWRKGEWANWLKGRLTWRRTDFWAKCQDGVQFAHLIRQIGQCFASFLTIKQQYSDVMTSIVWCQWTWNRRLENTPSYLFLLKIVKKNNIRRVCKLCAEIPKLYGTETKISCSIKMGVWWAISFIQLTQAQRITSA